MDKRKPYEPPKPAKTRWPETDKYKRQWKRPGQTSSTVRG